MTKQEFLDALYCWQLNVTMAPGRINDSCYEVTVSFSTNQHTETIARDMLFKSTVERLAKRVLGSCYDCSNFPIHPNVKSYGGTKCRACTLKGGDKSSFAHEFDLDKMREIVGSETLRKLIDRCSWDRW